ncbi:DHH family phosphoesterase [Spiroplasma endosymbiont of Virgichneumon dumeticola]|uniref:DHH family phosphoesterase n=1 Tax=Spiroplasma endosymbiont of Virgichneumon dumeticola TaxID=3139323 RepID=UPI0035C92750
MLYLIILSKYECSDNKVLSCCLEVKICQSLNISAAQANEEVDLLANIDDAKIWMMFSQSVVDGPITGIFRSNRFPVNNVAHQFGGGGHVHFTGGTFETWKQVREIIKAYDQLVKEIHNY